MILLDVKSYIRQHGQVSLTDIVNHFDIDAYTAQAMVQRLISQGFVHIVPNNARMHNQDTNACKSCTLQINSMDRYQWLSKKYSQLNIDITSNQ